MRRFIACASFALAALVLSASAQAETLLVDNYGFGQDYAGFNYRFDSARGTAWIDLHFTQESGMGYERAFHTAHFTRSAPVRGLSFDAAASQVVFTSMNGAKSVCATVAANGRKLYVRATGACRVFGTRRGRAMSVYFQAQ
jgi:hypothetical protein